MIVRSFLHDIRREWQLAIADRVMPLTISIIGFLTLLAMLSGWLRTNQRLSFQETIQRENRLQQSFLESAFDQSESTDAILSELTPTQTDRRFELQITAISPDLMRYTGGIWWTIYPVSPLSSLSMGVSGQWPDHYLHGGSSIPKTLTRSVRSNPLLATVGAFDLTLLVGAILPLAVIVLTYNVVAADREQGRWLLVGLHASSTAQLIVARCVARVGTLAITVLVLTAGCILFTKFNQWDIATVRSFLVWAIWLSAYLTFWTALAISVNFLPLSSSAAGLLLLLCWSFFVIAVPSAVQQWVNLNHQIPSQATLIAVEKEIQEQVEQESETIWTDFSQQNQDIHFDKENPQQEYLLRDIALDRAIRSRVQVELDGYYQRFLDRESALDQAQFLSPLLAWRTAADQSAGTSLRHSLDFAKQTSQFHETYLRYFEPFSIAGQELSRAEIQNIPRFDADQLQARLYWPSLLMSAASLLAWIAFAGLFSWQNFQRHPTQ